MTREDLKKYELTDEQVDEIMELNGNAIEKHKAKSITLQAKLTETEEELTKRDNEFKELKETSGDTQALKDKFATLETEYEQYKQDTVTRETEYKLNSALQLAIGTSGTIDEVALKAHLDLSKIELNEDGTLKGVDEQITTLKEDKKYLFEKTFNSGSRRDRQQTNNTTERDTVLEGFGVTHKK